MVSKTTILVINGLFVTFYIHKKGLMKIFLIGVGRFRIFGDQGLEYWGGGGGGGGGGGPGRGKFPAGTRRRNDVDAT